MTGHSIHPLLMPYKFLSRAKKISLSSNLFKDVFPTPPKRTCFDFSPIIITHSFIHYCPFFYVKEINAMKSSRALLDIHSKPDWVAPKPAKI